jgi:hypothetical protein
MGRMFSRPDITEHNPYYSRYIDRVPQGNILELLAQQPAEYRQLLADLSEAEATAAPAPGKWSVKQVLGHVCDTERVMAYRALRFARGDQQELPGFEQDDYAREADSNGRTVQELLSEFDSIRHATLALFSSLPAGAETRQGIASGSPVTVRALAYIIAGHAQHHYELLKAVASKAARAQ